MPIFDYQCAECNRVFDIYHRGGEKEEKIKCPACGSVKYNKLVSVPAAVGHGAGDSPADSCSNNFGRCCGGGACN